MSDTVKVVIAFAPNGENEGKVVDMDAAQAREAVREGRARHLTDDDHAAAKGGKGKGGDAAS